MAESGSVAQDALTLSKIFALLIMSFSAVSLLISLVSAPFILFGGSQQEKVGLVLSLIFFAGVGFAGWMIYSTSYAKGWDLIVEGVKKARERNPETFPSEELEAVEPTDFGEKEDLISFTTIPFILPTKYEKLAEGLDMEYDRKLKGLSLVPPFIGGPLTLKQEVSGEYNGCSVIIRDISPRSGSLKGRGRWVNPNVELSLATEFLCPPVIVMSRQRDKIGGGDLTPLDWKKLKSQGVLGRVAWGFAELFDDVIGVDLGTDLPTIRTDDPYTDIAFNILTKEPEVKSVFQLPWVRSGLLGLGLGSYIKFDGKQVIARFQLIPLNSEVVGNVLDFLIRLAERLSKYSPEGK